MFHKHSDVQNEYRPLVYEFLDRKQLSTFGVTASSRDLPAWKADAFLVINDKWNELEYERRKRQAEKDRRRVRRRR